MVNINDSKKGKNKPPKNDVQYDCSPVTDQCVTPVIAPRSVSFPGSTSNLYTGHDIWATSPYAPSQFFFCVPPN